MKEQIAAEKLFIESTWNWFESEWKEALRVSRQIDLFWPALVVWLMILERLGSKRGLKGALESLRAGSANEVVSKIGVSKPLRYDTFSSNTSGYSKARQRLPIDKVVSFVDVLTSELQKRLEVKQTKKSKIPVLYIDGSYFSIERTRTNLEKYPSSRNQHRELHNSQMIAVFAHDMETGISHRPEFGAYCGANAVSEIALARKLMERLPKASLLVLDRGFGVFQIALYAQTHGHEVLMRLTKRRSRRFLDCFSKSDFIDEPVIWTPTVKDSKKHQEYPVGAKVAGRIIHTIIRRKGFKPIELTLFTTSTALASELLERYRSRQNIENDFRSLKHTIGADFLYCKSPEMVEKEILLAVASYNLVRALIAIGAQEVKLEPRRISFSGAISAIRSFGVRLQKVNSSLEKQLLWKRYLLDLKQNKLPDRKKLRIEPRKIARSHKHWCQISKSREQERKESHLLSSSRK